MIGTNKTLVATVAASTAFTGSIQRIYSTGSIVLSQIDFGYFNRVGTTGSKAIITSTTAMEGGTAVGTTIEGPIVNFKTAATSDQVLVYHNNVKL
tara:strand:+ start:388 stop:672 length:285 start_codon:yes stop_codon:yes gene_type:complete